MMDPAHEIRELKSEISRHHRDFDQISRIAEQVLKRDPLHPGYYPSEIGRFVHAMKRIRNIVG